MKKAANYERKRVLGRSYCPLGACSMGSRAYVGKAVASLRSLKRFARNDSRLSPFAAPLSAQLLPEAQLLANRGRPRLLATLGRILSQPTLDVSLPPPAGDSPADDDAPLQVELIHHVSRPIHTLEELNREQAELDRAREKLLRQ